MKMLSLKFHKIYSKKSVPVVWCYSKKSVPVTLLQVLEICKNFKGTLMQI